MKSVLRPVEESKFELEIAKLFLNSVKNFEPKTGLMMKNFNENLFVLKCIRKIIQTSNITEETNSTSSLIIRCLKTFFILKNIQTKMMMENSTNLEFLTKELIIYNIYKDFEDPNSKNGILLNDLLLLMNILLYEYIGEYLTINKEKTESPFIEMFLEEKEKEKVTHISLLTLGKILKTVVPFLVNSEKYKMIFEAVDQEGKGKVLTAELVVCLNKVSRSLTEADKMILRLRQLTELVDISKVYIKKVDFYKLAIQASIYKGE